MKVQDIYVDIEVTLNVFCECGTVLVGEFERWRELWKIQVEPCKTCMTKEYNEGFDSGYETGVKDEHRRITVA